jgi:hypothetical protein
VEGERKREAEEERGEAVDEVRLEREFIGVPNAVEETFPELLQVIVGEIGLRWKPGFEEEAESFVACGLVAITELLYQ